MRRFLLVVALIATIPALAPVLLADVAALALPAAVIAGVASIAAPAVTDHRHERKPAMTRYDPRLTRPRQPSLP